MKKSVVRKMVMWGLALSLALLSLTACASGTDPVVRIGEDQVPSLYTVAGEKKVNGTSSTTSNGKAVKILTYWQGGVSPEEAKAYAEALEGQGYTMVTKSELDLDVKPFWQVAKNSVQDGKLVVATIEFTDDGECKITYQLTPGSIQE